VFLTLENMASVTDRDAVSLSVVSPNVSAPVAYLQTRAPCFSPCAFHQLIEFLDGPPIEYKWLVVV
jgi:hypothetical protein